MIRSLFLIITLSATMFSALASDIQILGLTKDKVVMEVDGETKVLRVGEAFDGIKVLNADSDHCTLEINGQPQDFKMGSQISTHFSPAAKPMVRLEQDSRGLYRATGKINDHLVNFIVDTGATLVAINANQAKSLEIDYTKGKPTQVDTANGKANAYLISLPEVSLGAIRVYDVPAVVVEGDSPAEILLGMSFLKRLEIRDNNQLLELQQKY